MVVLYGCRTYVWGRRLCGSFHSSVTREGQGGTYQYHTVGSHIFLVTDVHLHPILFICPAGGKAARRIRTAHAIGCGIHALVCAVLSVHRIAQFGYVFLEAGRFAQFCHDVQCGGCRSEHPIGLSVHLPLGLGNVRCRIGKCHRYYGRRIDDSILSAAPPVRTALPPRQDEPEKHAN